MVNPSVTGTPLGHLGWNRDDGLPEVVMPGARTSSLGDPPPPERRAPLEVRVLGDGSPQVSALFATGVKAVRLGSARHVVTYTPRGRVIDLVVNSDGTGVVLEAGNSGLVAVHGVSSTGSMLWSADDVMPVDQKPRLLTDASGSIYVGGLGVLLGVAGGRVAAIISWAGGGEPLMDPHGNVGFVSYDPVERTRSFVLLNPATGEQTPTVAQSDAWGILTRPIGIDADGCAYGFSGGILGRMGHDGHADWQISLDDLEATQQGAVTAMPGAHAVGSVAGDASLTRNTVRSPSVSSVTARGEVITAVVGPGGVYVVGLNAL